MVDIVITNLLPHRSLGSGSSPPVFLRNKSGFFGYLYSLLNSRLLKLVAISLFLARKFIKNWHSFSNSIRAFKWLKFFKKIFLIYLKHKQRGK